MSRRSFGSVGWVPIAVVSLLAGPAGAFEVTPELGQISGLTAPIVDPDTGAWSAQTQPRAASSGAGSLVVWSERDAAGLGDIRATRLAPDGTVLDPDGIDVFVGPGDQRVPDVTWDGESWFVVWESRTVDANGNVVDYGDVYGIHVSSEGAVLDLAEILIVSGWGQHGYPSVAFGEGVYLVAWHGPDATVRATAVSRTGVVYTPGGFVLVDAPEGQTYPSVAYAPGSDTFLVVWADRRRTATVPGEPFSHEWPPFDVYGMRLRLDAAMSPVFLDAVSGPSPSLPIHVGDQCDRRPRLATDGTDFLVVDSCVNGPGTWNGTDVRMTAMAHRVTPGGAVSPPVAVSTPEMDAWGAVVAWAWPGYVVAWVDGAAAPPEIRARRVSAAGAPTDAAATLVAPDARFLLEPPPPEGRLLFTSHLSLSPLGARDALAAYGRPQSPGEPSRVRGRILDLDAVDPSCTLVAGIVGCYTFDGDVLDHGGNLNHGVLSGELSYVAGKRGAPLTALRLDGIDDFVSVANEGAFDLGELSISAVVRLADLQGDQWIVSKGPRFGNFTMLVYGSDAGMAGQASYVHETSGGNWSAPVSSAPLAAHEWVHLLVTVSPTEYRAYVNGALQWTAPPAPPLANDAAVILGGGGYYGLSSFFAGDVDAVRIYDRALTGDDVCALHNATFNTAPVAAAGPDQAPVLAGSTVALDGTQSWDPDGDALGYRWAFLSRPAGSSAVLANAATATPTFVADAYGTYVVELVVTDPCLESADTVTVSFQNVAPVADAGASREATVGDTVTLDGSRSSDANGDALAYAWTLAAPPGSAAVLASPTAAVTTFLADVPGTFVATLVVSDGVAASDPASVQIEVVAHVTTALEAAQAIQAAIAELGPGALKNANMKNALLNKLNAVIRDIADGNYAAALEKTENDVLGKTDGCAVGGDVDRNDWVVTCPDQARIYPLVLQLIAILRTAG